jgi:3-hydroxyacyl-CoA dehydrogenase/enoyl-CoA hydratase/3-hydroxybutyryl-CoA epimerase/enoyl-CoA isomerase
LAEALQRPENFCGIHFFNPVHAMPLVEVVVGEKTSDDTVSRAVSYVLAIGKKPVVVKDCPGFLVNRTLFMYFGGFHMLMREGADHEQVDQAMETWGWPMGPAYLSDVVGLDTAVHAGDVVADGFADRLLLDYKSSTHVMVEAGRFGQKNGRGYYKFEKNDKKRLEKLVDPETKALLADYVAAPKSFSEEEIVARMMIPMATEMARCLEEGVVGSPQEADQALLYGLGFPPFRGGICRWMDEVGLAKICAMADKFSHLGGMYHPTEAMRAMAKEGKTYY